MVQFGTVHAREWFSWEWFIIGNGSVAMVHDREWLSCNDS